MSLIDTIRSHEPPWLAEKRKAIFGPVPGAIVAVLLHYGIHLDTYAANAIGLAVAALSTYLIPNRLPVVHLPTMAMGTVIQTITPPTMPPNASALGVKWG